MLNVNFEFRKGIFFIRLFGDMSKQNFYNETEELKKIIIANEFKYIVLNTNYIHKIDLEGLNYLLELYYISKEFSSNLVLCDKTNVMSRLINSNIPHIKDEIEVL